MQKQILKLLFLLTMFFVLPSFVLAAPEIASVTMNAGALNISGINFGTKLTSTPIADINFDSDIAGQIPNSWLSPQSDTCLVSNALYRGSKSLDCSAVNWPLTEYFPRVTLDMNKNIGTNSYLYFTLWLYLSDPGAQINWKGPLLTSSTTPTYWQSGITNNNAIGVGAWWDPGNNPYPRWYNTAITTQYSQDGTAAFNYCLNGNSASPDSYVFGQWQRIEYTIKTSSSAVAADGYVKVERVGKSLPVTNATGCITHGNTSDPWRYFSLPQGITNVLSTPWSLQMYFDDLYIDDSLSHIELCDSSTWSARTHCEIQKPTAWSSTSVTASINQGSFVDGSNAYLYLVDENGIISAGFPVSFASGADIVAPNAPTGLGVL